MNKIEYIVKACRKQTVLDIGAAEYNQELQSIDQNWMHGLIKRVATSVDGIDTHPSVKKPNKYNLYYGNAEYLENVSQISGRIFSVIVMGDVIEHLTMPGKCLRDLLLYSNENTKLIITTPSGLSLHFWFPFMFRKREFTGIDHTVVFTIQTLTTLLNKCGWDVVDASYLHFYKTKWYQLDRIIYRALFPHLAPKIAITAIPLGYERDYEHVKANQQ